MSGLRYWRLLSGYPDWSKWDGRYKQVLRIVDKKDCIRRNYQFNLELMFWTNRNVTALTDWQTLDKAALCLQNNELFSAMRIGFFLLLRISAIEGLSMKDVRIAREDGKSYLTIFVAGGKTDQYNQGDFKRLEEVGGLCPLAEVARYLHLIQWVQYLTNLCLGRIYGEINWFIAN